MRNIPGIRQSVGPVITTHAGHCKTVPQRFARSGLVAALLMAGTLTQADPVSVYFSQTNDFVLSTSNQNMFGSGSNTGWSYDSGFQGMTWGRYNGPSASPSSATVGDILGDRSTVLIPKLCAWSPWGDVCTPEVTADTRTGASLTVESSGKIGMSLSASAQGGGISATVPIEANLVITQNAAGTLHVGGSSKIDTTAAVAPMITTKAPSFKAAVDTQLALKMAAEFDACLIGAGCAQSAQSFGFDLSGNLVGVDTSKTKPLSVLGLDVPVPAANKWYELRKDNTSEQSPSSNFKPQGPILAQVKVDLPKDASGGQVQNDQIVLSGRTAAVHVDADITGLAQAGLGLPVDLLNPRIEAKAKGIGLSLEANLLDYQAGVFYGMDQSFSLKPKLAVELQFDKPVSEYVQHIDHYETAQIGNSNQFNFAGLKFGSGSSHSTNYCGTAAKQIKADYQAAYQAWLSTHPGGTDSYSDYPRAPDPADISCTDEVYVYTNDSFGWENLGSKGREIRRLGPNDNLDPTYGGYQCKQLVVDPALMPWSNGVTDKWQCIAGSLETRTPVFQQVPVYTAQPVLEDRGSTVVVDLDQGADLHFNGDPGKLVGWRYTMSDETNFTSKTSVSVGIEDLLKAACVNASITGIASFNECLFKYGNSVDFMSNLDSEAFPGISVFNESFNLAGFNSVQFTTGNGPGGGGTVPEPGTLSLIGLALAALSSAAARRQARR